MSFLLEIKNHKYLHGFIQRDQHTELVIQNMDYKRYAALEQVLRHTRDTVIKRQTLELEKLQRKLSRIEYSYGSLIEYICLGQDWIADPPQCCQQCGCWNRSVNTWCFFKFYSDIETGDELHNLWVLERVFICDACFDKSGYFEGECSYADFLGKLCTKYKLSYWCQQTPRVEIRDLALGHQSSIRDFVLDDDFDDDYCDYELARVPKKSTFILSTKSESYSDYFLSHKPHKMHHVAAFIIQRGFRYGWNFKLIYTDNVHS